MRPAADCLGLPVRQSLPLGILHRRQKLERQRRGVGAEASSESVGAEASSERKRLGERSGPKYRVLHCPPMSQTSCRETALRSASSDRSESLSGRQRGSVGAKSAESLGNHRGGDLSRNASSARAFPSDVRSSAAPVLSDQKSLGTYLLS